MKLSSPECKITFLSKTICSDTLRRPYVTLTHGLDTEIDFVTEFDILPNYNRFQ